MTHFLIFWTVIFLIQHSNCIEISLIGDPVAITQNTIQSWVTTRVSVFRTRTVLSSSSKSSTSLSSGLSSRSSKSSAPSTVTCSPSTSYSSSSSSPTPSSSTSFQSQMLETHNRFRDLHDAPALRWSSDLQDFAQKYANNYNCNGTLIHSGSPYGENLALGFNTTAAASAWYDEVKFYNYQKPGFSEKTGHFTQLVWKSSIHLGCARIDCGDYYGQYTICSYDPPGNVAGQYQDNVLAT